MPVVDAIIVAILPDDRQRVGADSHHVGQARRRGLFHDLCEHFRVWFGFHVFMPAAAGRARAGRAQ